MTRSKRIRAVYAELRAALGDQVTAGEAATLAARLVGIASHRKVVDLFVDICPEAMSVDEMIRGHGWEIVEDACHVGYFDDDELGHIARPERVDRLMRMAA